MFSPSTDWSDMVAAPAIEYKNGRGSFTLYRNEGMRIVAFDIEQLRFALATSAHKRGDRTGCTFHVQRDDGRDMELVAFPVTGTWSYISETTEEYCSFESTMVSPQHERLYFCLVDITPGSANPGHIWRLL